MLPRGASRLTPPTATKPSKTLTRSRTSSTARPTEEAPGEHPDGAGDAAGEAEQEHHQDRAQHERPVLGVRDDLLVQEDQDQRADARAEEGPMPPSRVMIRTSDDFVQ